MCTLILLDRVVPQIPVIVAANRDEFFSRPAAPPTRFGALEGRPAFAAPHDLEAGGTWMGVNEHGVFVGLTNRPVAAKPTGVRSRGLLVVDVLGAASAERAGAEFERQRNERYAPFNLLATDGREAWLARQTAEGERERRALAPGIHVVCNRDPGDPSSTKVARLQARLAELDLGAAPEALVTQLFGVLGAHPDPSNPFENPCVHTAGYGTRSSSVLLAGPQRRAYWYADGAPCDTKYRDFTALLDDLHVPAGLRA
jgi:uncharacterized protein with NRDE domain